MLGSLNGGQPKNAKDPHTSVIDNTTGAMISAIKKPVR